MQYTLHPAVVLCALLLMTGVVRGQTIYVDALSAGTNDGTSWANALNHLQDALAAAGPGSEIWVAQGTYRPDESTANPTGTGSRAATFQLITGVGVYGGFPAGGGDGTFAARDVQAFLTTLSGDLHGDDDGFLNIGENSYHVVTGSGTGSTAAVDGFTVGAGNANGSFPDIYGGGMLNYAAFSSSSPTVSNCTFTGNTALLEGGGMYNGNSSATVSNCTFAGNTADSGGGMYNGGSGPTVRNCRFAGNTALVEGGGMGNLGSSPTVSNCTFAGNTAGTWGGGMANNSGSSPTVSNCTFSGNSASVGGGMLNYHQCSPTVSNCTIVRNTADSGGGMYNVEGSPTVRNCILWLNTAPSGPQILNDPSTPAFLHCNIEASGGSGGGWDTALGTDGAGNIDADPLFLDADGADGTFGTDDDDQRLSSGSPSLDAGRNDLVAPDTADLDSDGDTAEPLPFDLDGNVRFFDDVAADCPQGGCGTAPIVDMGAYERCGFCPNGAPADTNADGVVDVDDLINVLLDWATAGLTHGGDVNGDGVVDVDDLVMVLMAMTPP